MSDTPVEAFYPGVCACCDKNYGPGTDIIFDWDLNGWVIAINHVPTRGEMCDKHFIEKSLTGVCPMCED